MSKDIKIFNACTHIVNNKYYDINLCPRCNGKGYYYDIAFDQDGQAILATETVKFQQESLKILHDELGGNPFHPLWGSEITDKIVGSKNTKNTKLKLNILIRKVLEYLTQIQINNQQLYKNMTELEILDNIVSINILNVNTTGYIIEITLQNKGGKYFVQKISL